MTPLFTLTYESCKIRVEFHSFFIFLKMKTTDLYVGWYIYSFPLFYSINKRKGVKDGFVTYYCLNAQWTTFWIDVTVWVKCMAMPT